MNDHNPLDVIGRHFPVEFMNPNPKMTPLASGDRFTLTVEIHKDLFDLFCEVGRDGRAGMIIDGMLMVSERPSPIAYEDEGEPVIEEPEIVHAELDREPPKIDHKNSQFAAMYCKTESFQLFVARGSPGQGAVRATESYARQQILDHCEINSRAELDTNMRAQRIFIDRFCKPYTAYMRDR